MKFKAFLLHPITFFILGILVAIGGLALNDYYTQPAVRAAAPTRIAVATRTTEPTATESPTETMEPTQTSEPTTTPEALALASDSASTPTVEFTPTGVSTATVLASPTTSVTLPATRRPATLTSALRVTPTVSTTTTANGKKGDSPFTAIDITGNWDTVGPNKQLWFKTGTETSYPLRGAIALDAYGKTGIGFAVYSPEQANDLNVLTIPKGRGAYDKTIPTHDLIWTGGSPKAGIWYVLLTNSNPVPVEYKLISTFNATEHKNCFQYWESINGGPLMLWTECNRAP